MARLVVDGFLLGIINFELDHHAIRNRISRVWTFHN